MKPKSVKELKAALKDSQGEAASYLNRLNVMAGANESLRERISQLMKALRQEQERVNGLDHACAILFRSLELHQQGK